MRESVPDSAAWQLVEDQTKNPVTGFPNLPQDQAALLWAFNKNVESPRRRAQIATAIVTNERDRCPVSAAPDDATLRNLNKLVSDGYVPLSPALNREQTQEILRYMAGCEPNKIIHSVQYYSLQDIVGAPYLLDIALDQNILSLASAFLGMPATLLDMSLLESLAGDPEPQGSQIFHRDRDDFRSFKMFIYLDDVSEHDGPHIFVRGSHDYKRIAQILNITDASVLTRLYEGNGRLLAPIIEKFFGSLVTEIIGPAGTSFAVNTYGFHRGKVPTGRRRVAFDALYGVIPYPQRAERMATAWPVFSQRDSGLTAAQRHAARLMFPDRA